MQVIINKDYPKKIIPLLEQAKTNIDIMMYQWGYYSYLTNCDVQKLTLAIKSAIIRGVPVRVLLHAGSPNDTLRTKNCETFNHLNSWGAKVKWYKRGARLHAKLLMIDKTFAVVGSHNFSKQSMSTNIETSVLVEGSGEIRPLQEYFELLWGHS
jgi:cardiolipin synthase